MGTQIQNPSGSSLAMVLGRAVSCSTMQYLNEEAVLPFVNILALFDHSKHCLEHLQMDSYFSP